MALLVDRRLAFSPASTFVGQDAQVASAWVGEWFVCTHYAPPDAEAEAQSLAASCDGNPKSFPNARHHSHAPLDLPGGLE